MTPPTGVSRGLQETPVKGSAGRGLQSVGVAERSKKGRDGQNTYVQVQKNKVVLFLPWKRSLFWILGFPPH